ncbi:hypothetical protein MRX96_059522 [Rhipicephalus microplus]
MRCFRKASNYVASKKEALGCDGKPTFRQMFVQQMSRKRSPISIVGPLRFTESPGRHRWRRSKTTETTSSNLGVPVAQSRRSDSVVRILDSMVALLCFSLFRCTCFATSGVGLGRRGVRGAFQSHSTDP